MDSRGPTVEMQIGSIGVGLGMHVFKELLKAQLRMKTARVKHRPFPR